MNNFSLINHHLSFCQGVVLHVWDKEYPIYQFELSEKYGGKWVHLHHGTVLPYNFYNYCGKQTRTDYRVKVIAFHNDELITLIDHTYNDTNESVLLSFKTDSYKEAQIWTDLTLKWNSKNMSKVTIESKFADRLQKDYKDEDLTFVVKENINTVQPDKYYAYYRIGKFHIPEEPLGHWGSAYSLYENHFAPRVSEFNKNRWLGMSSEDIFNDIMNL